VSDRTGQVWELVYRRKPAEVIVVVASKTRGPGLKSSHACLVLADAGIEGEPAFGWPEGCVKMIGDWDDACGWRRIA
jgi:hypothetical protein